MTIPKLSPYVLLQETLWPNEWLILVSCVMLNQTSRRQVEKIFDGFLSSFPSVEDIVSCDIVKLTEVIKPLGFGDRRGKTLKKLAEAYLHKDVWRHARDLPGIGEYGSRAWEIFCMGILGDEAPKDGALKIYWEWRTLHTQPFSLYV